MAADFKFLMEFGVESKEVDTVLSNVKAVKATLAEIKSAGTLGDVMGTEDIEEARIALDKMISSLERMKQEGQDLINADEMARECQRLSTELNRVDSSMENVERTSEDVEDNLRDATRETRSFRAALGEVAGTMTAVHRASDNINKAFSKLGDTLKWKVIDTAVNSIQGGLQSAYYFAKDLDRVMTEIRIVTGNTAGEVENFVTQAGGLADELGTTMLKFSEASVLFLQQGKSREDAIELAKQTVIAANITGTSSRQAAELMTAAQEGFRRSAEEASNTLDIFARLGAETGSNFEEIATALSKSASSFSAAGFDIERASAALATVSSVTRQSAEQVGTGFKTIIARLTSVKAGGEDGAEAISKIEEALKRVNEEMKLTGDDVISIFSKDGDMKDGQAILETIGDNWEKIKDSTSQVTQNILLEAVAGKEQANRMLALYESWDMYQDAVEKAINSEGYAYQQQLIYQDSLKAKLSELSNEFQKLFTSEVGTDPFKKLIGSATELISRFNDLADRGVVLEKIIAPIASVIGIKMLQNVSAVSTSFSTWVTNLKPSHILLEQMQAGTQKMLGIDTQRDAQLQKDLANYQRKLVVNEQILQQDLLTLEMGQRNGLLDAKEIADLERKIARQQEYVSLIQKGIGMKQTELSSGGKLASLTKNMSGMLAIGMQAVSMVKTLSSETATMNDKVDAGIKTAATGLGALVGGPIGALVGSLVGDVLGALINIESQAEKTAKKMAGLKVEVDESIKAYAESSVEVDKAMGSVLSLKQSMGDLDTSTMSYYQAMNILQGSTAQYTETQREQATALQQVALEQGAILAQLSPLEVSYDELGRAIVDNVYSYDELIAKIQEYKREIATDFISDENLISNVQEMIKYTEQQLNEAQAKFNQEKNAGGVSKEAVDALKEAQAANREINEQVQSIARSLRDANVEYANLSNNAKVASSFLFDTSLIREAITESKNISYEAYQEVADGFTSYLKSATDDQIEALGTLSNEQKIALVEMMSAYGVQAEQVSKVMEIASKDFDGFFSNYRDTILSLQGLDIINVQKEQENARLAIEEYNKMYQAFSEASTGTMNSEEWDLLLYNLDVAQIRLQEFIDKGVVQSQNGTYEIIDAVDNMFKEIDDMMSTHASRLYIVDPESLEIEKEAVAQTMEDFQLEIQKAEGPIVDLTDAIDTMAYEGIKSFNNLGEAAQDELIKAFSEIRHDVPGLTSLLSDMMDGSIEDTEEYADTFFAAMDTIKENLPELYKDIIGNSEQFYQEWLGQNQQLFAQLFEQMGLDAETIDTDYSTLLELKQGLIEGIINQQGVVSEEMLIQLAGTGMFTMEELVTYCTGIRKIADLEAEAAAVELEAQLDARAGIINGAAIERLEILREEIRKTKEELAGLFDTLPDTLDVKKTTIDVPKWGGWEASKPKAAKKKKEKKEKEVADITYDEDILHKYKKQLEILEDKMAKYERAYDHAFGYDKIKNLQQQNKILEERASILQKEISLIEKQTEGYANLLKEQGFAMNEVGTIVNKDEVFKKLYESANAQKGADAREKAQEDVKAIEEVFSKYEANVKLKIDTTKALNEAYHEIQDNYKKGFEIDLNLVLDVNKLLREVKEVQDSMVNGFGTAAKQMDNLAKAWQTGAEDLDRIAFNMERIVNDPKLDAVAKYELMQDNMSQFISEFENLQDKFEEILDLQKEVVSESAELVKTQLEGFEKLIGYAADLADLYSSFYGDDGYKKASDFYAIQIKGIKEQEKGTQGLIDSLDIYLQKLEVAGQKGSEAWKETKKQIADLQDQMVQLASETVSVLQQQYDQFIDVAVNKLQKSLFGMSFDELSSKMDKFEKSQAKYLDTTEKVVKVSDLHAKIQNQINKLNDPTRQAELTEQLQKQMEMLREKDGLTERDLQRAELQYQLLLKQQAVEAQAQSGKMVGRLTRDESGNWAMEYVADLEEVEKVQEELSETLNSLVAFDRESLEQNQDEIMDLLGDLNSRSQDIIREYKNNPAEMARQLEKLEQEFGKELDVLRKEREELMKNYMESSINSIFEVAKTDDKALDVFGKANAETLKKITEALSSGDLTTEDILSKNTGKIANALGMDVKDVEKALDSMFKQINDDFKDFNDILGNIDVSDIGSAFDQIVGQSQSMINEITAAMKDYEDAIGNLNKKLEEQRKATEEANKQSANQLGEVGNLVEAFGAEGGLNDQFKAANEFATMYFDTLNTRLQEVKDHIAQTDVYTASQLASEKQLDATTKATNVNTKSSEGLQKQTEKTEKATISATGKMDSFEGQLYDTNAAARTATNGVNSLHDSIDALHDKTITITTVYETVGGPSFDIGGYTGNRPYAGGVDGRGGFPATLHPQELILDRYDTKNMLKVVEAVRDMAKNGMLKNVSSSTNSLVNKTQSSISNSISESSQAVEQNYIVENINLPNVDNAQQFTSELKSIFSNMSNSAAQFAYRTKSN